MTAAANPATSRWGVYDTKFEERAFSFAPQGSLLRDLFENNGKNEEHAGCEAGQLRWPIGQSRAILQKTIAASPKTLPMMVPEPPKIEAPPRTTAVIAVSS